MASLEKRLSTQDLLCFLQDLPAVTLARLYHYSATCLAVFRELPDLSKQYIMRMLFLDHPLPVSVLESWPRGNSKSQVLHREAMAKLENLRVCDVVPVGGGQRGMQLSEAFKRNLHTLICGGGSPWALVGHSGEDKHARDVDYLNSYADKQWEWNPQMWTLLGPRKSVLIRENILHYMVGDVTEDITVETVEILRQAGLMSGFSGRGQPTITTQGFQFLLLDRSSQVWYFLLQYLTSAQNLGLDVVECLNFIFQLSFQILGKDYSTEGLTQTQLTFMQQLRQFGLIYQRKRSSKRYFPTKLAINLVSGHGRSGAKEGVQARSGFVVLETNFRVMAYTESQLQISILDLFCQLQYRFPNLVVGTITRESVHKALKNGITADQIISFLHQHAHPQMLSNTPVIPPTVDDQIRLWEKERDRLDMSEGVLYSEFLSVGDFEVVRKYAEDLGVLLWSNEAKRFIVVASSGHDEVRRFWRRHSKK